MIDLAEQVRQLQWEVLVGELRGIERQRQRLEDVGFFDKSESGTCWSCNETIRMTPWGWGHITLRSHDHPASPTKPQTRRRKLAKETE